jgi:hypothetical protein
MVTDEPPGWKRLQRTAQRETDPKKLAHIIKKMNQLLDAHFAQLRKWIKNN